LLIAGWAFDLYIHFDAWLSYIVERSPRVRSIYANVIGKEFEEYVISNLRKSGVVNKIYLKVIISQTEFPEIGECLKRLRKEKCFEIDIVIVWNNDVYLVSCKGGKRRKFIKLMSQDIGCSHQEEK